MTEIKLGDKVRDKYSGFEGTAMSKTEFLNGCIQFGVVAKIKKKEMISSPPMELEIDEGNLEVIETKEKKKIVKKTSNGGKSYMVAKKMRGF